MRKEIKTLPAVDKSIYREFGFKKYHALDKPIRSEIYISNSWSLC